MVQKEIPPSPTSYPSVCNQYRIHPVCLIALVPRVCRKSSKTNSKYGWRRVSSYCTPNCSFLPALAPAYRLNMAQQVNGNNSNV